MHKSRIITILATLASELDRDQEFHEADLCDNTMAGLCCDEILPEDALKTMIKVFKDKGKNIDDGRFGLNDADNPTVKAA